MAHESFEDEATAAVMNRLFVNIKVDREERPDIDQIYMAALHALGEQGGWPLTMFLTPDGEPIWGGTYFPPDRPLRPTRLRRHPREVARIFREEPDKVEQNRVPADGPPPRTPGRGGRSRSTAPSSTAPPNASSASWTASTAAFAARRNSPRQASSNSSGAPAFGPATAAIRDAVLLTLRNIAQGGIYDHLGGGFARYSVDDRWLVPHFEKMLYDNAQLVELLTYAFLATGDPLFQTRIEETIAWLLARDAPPGGAFAASLDADSEGHEGKFYVWTRDEVLDVLGAEEGAFFAAVYDITPRGNWEGASILNRLGRHAAPRPTRRSPPRRAPAPGSCARRATRVRPQTDDKILADWNGLMIAALAFAGATLRPARTGSTLAARAFRFVLDTMTRRRPPRPCLARRQVGLSRPRHRLCRHDQGGARAPRRDPRHCLSSTAPSRSPPRSAAIIGTRRRPAISSPPTTPRR